MATTPHTYTPKPPHVHGNSASKLSYYTAGENNDQMLLGGGAMVSVFPLQRRDCAHLNVSLNSMPVAINVGAMMTAAQMTDLAHRLLDAAADIKATAGQEVAA